MTTANNSKQRTKASKRGHPPKPPVAKSGRERHAKLGQNPIDPTASSSALSFDADEFIQYVKDHDLSEAEAYEFLATVWVYVVTWVDLGFGIHPAQQTNSKSATNFNPTLDHESALVLTCRETFNNRTNEKTVQRPKRRAERKDS